MWRRPDLGPSPPAINQPRTTILPRFRLLLSSFIFTSEVWYHRPFALAFTKTLQNLLNLRLASRPFIPSSLELVSTDTLCLPLAFTNFARWTRRRRSPTLRLLRQDLGMSLRLAGTVPYSGRWIRVGAGIMSPSVRPRVFGGKGVLTYITFARPDVGLEQ